MKVTLNLTCKTCPRLGHSGAFTKGGAKPVCEHPHAVYWFTNGKSLSQPDDTWSEERIRSAENRYHWMHRVIDLNKEPPKECPLRHKENL